VQTATPGQRTAVSLSGVEKETIIRGGVISGRADLSHYADHPVLALQVQMVADAPVPLGDRRRVLLIVGTTEVEGEVRMYDRKEIKPGEEGTVFFKPYHPVYALVGDHYIVRLVTPMDTLGGGRILDHLERLPRRKELHSYTYLRERLTGDLTDLLISELRKRPLIRASRLLEHADVAQAAVDSEVEALLAKQELGRFGEFVYHVSSLESAVEQYKKAVGEFLKDKPHLKGLTLETIVRLAPQEKVIAERLVAYLLAEKVLVQDGELYNLAGRGMVLKGIIKQAHDDIMAQLRDAPFEPPPLSSFASQGKHYQQAIKYMLDTREVHKCGAEYLFLQESWQEMVAFARERLAATGQLAVGDLRDKFSITRKWVIPILEETDRLRITKRQGDVRVKGDRFESEDAAV